MSAPALETGPEVFEVGEVGSALDVAWSMVKDERLPVFGSVLAESQSAGRGRHGRSWSSEPGNVYAALRLPQEPPFSETSAPLAVALLLAEGLERLEAGLSISIKWPNDLLTPGGKVGGILLESRDGALLAGIGLNLGKAPSLPDRAPEAPPPAALPADLGPPGKLWRFLVKSLARDYNKSFGRPPADWRERLAAAARGRLEGLGRPCVVKGPATTPVVEAAEIRGIVAGLAPSGALLVETPRGVLAVWSGALVV